MTCAGRSEREVSSPKGESSRQGRESKILACSKWTVNRGCRWVSGFLCVVAAGSPLLFLNNNISLSNLSLGEFTSQLERASEHGTNWVDAHAVAITTNAALVYMIVDMAAMSGDIRLRRLVDSYLGNPFLPANVWRRMVDEKAEIRPPSRAELDSWAEYQRWMAYGIAPNLIHLADDERADLFSPDK